MVEGARLDIQELEARAMWLAVQQRLIAILYGQTSTEEDFKVAVAMATVALYQRDRFTSKAVQDNFTVAIEAAITARRRGALPADGTKASIRRLFFNA